MQKLILFAPNKKFSNTLEALFCISTLEILKGQIKPNKGNWNSHIAELKNNLDELGIG